LLLHFVGLQLYLTIKEQGGTICQNKTPLAYYIRAKVSVQKIYKIELPSSTFMLRAKNFFFGKKTKLGDSYKDLWQYMFSKRFKLGHFIVV
jgi:hypothetical protein